MMAKYIMVLMLAVCPLLAFANYDGNDDRKQGRPGRFSPEEYMQKEVAFLTEEAKLTPEEAKAFFPLLREMKAKQRELQKRKGQLMFNASKNNVGESECLKTLNKILDIDEDIIDIEEDYQKKFLKIISASKLLNVKVAEHKFQRKMLREMSRRPHGRFNGKQKTEK